MNRLTPGMPPLAPPRDSQIENIKDTIESLVVAFILAFVFRGFLVEAFVIPTGSMAPSLYGQHGLQICPDCGWEFAFGSSGQPRIKCPNCGKESYVENANERSGRSDVPSSPATSLASGNTTVSSEPLSGDRILVFKWVYDLGGSLLAPHRWDVVVFKNPANGEHNFIKRLIGLPNEVLEIIDGDIYACPISALDEEARALLEQAVELKYRAVKATWEKQPGIETPETQDAPLRQLSVLEKKITPLLEGQLQIQRKTPVAQKSLWQIVFHQDFLPSPDVRPQRPRWESLAPSRTTENCWDTSDRIVRFHGADSGQQTIEFTGKKITDFYAYNFGGPIGEPPETVGDLRIHFVLSYEGGDGNLSLELTKNDDAFDVRLNRDGEVVLTQADAQGQKSSCVLAAGQIPPWRIGQPVEIEFTNVDYRVSLRVDGREIPVVATTDENYSPDFKKLRLKSRTSTRPSRARISADHLDISLSHLSLWRDVYYTECDLNLGRDGRSTIPGWGTTGFPICLRRGEYFVLGDNSPKSQDSRLWEEPADYLKNRGIFYQVGTVPDDQMIGRAFFVYWPSGFHISWIPALRDVGLIPDVGKMRWIR